MSKADIARSLIDREIKPRPRGNTRSKLEKLYADENPEILEAVATARAERKLSFSHIADIINGIDPDAEISAGAISNYLKKKGIT